MFQPNEDRLIKAPRWPTGGRPVRPDQRKGSPPRGWVAVGEGRMLRTARTHHPGSGMSACFGYSGDEITVDGGPTVMRPDAAGAGL